MSPDQVEQQLNRHADHVFVDDPEGEHLSDELIAQAVDAGREFSQDTLHHLRSCRECSEVLASLLAAQPESKVRSLFGRRHALLGGAVALAAAAAFVLVPGNGYRSKGAKAVKDADVVVVAVKAGDIQELRGGEGVAAGSQIGFRYGNVAARHQTLTVIGWDGKTIHWFYPESAGGAPFNIEGGPQARNLRLPFDTKLDQTVLGEFTIYAAFDVEPDVLATAVKNGSTDDSVLRTKISVSAGE